MSHFRVTFETEVNLYDARMTRDAAIEWLRSRGFGGLTRPATGETIELADLNPDQMCQAIATWTWGLVKEVRSRGGDLHIRHEPDDEPRQSVAVDPASVHAIRVCWVDDDGSAPEDEDREAVGLAFDDIDWDEVRVT